MAKVSQARMYSWWWDSHISPKNSRWLQENLTDMDSKVKSMIKLIEEDADSFARRAEMYYKKRPELMKLVEEFYRAYRALAERYDNATGVLKQAHKTMTVAFPNQNPMIMADELSELASSETDPRTPEMSHPTRGVLEPDDLHKDALGFSSSQFRSAKSNGSYTEESDSRKSVKQLNGLFGSGQNGSEGRVKRGLNFHEAEVKGRSAQKKDQDLSEVVAKFEKEIQVLKETLKKLEAEKEAGLAQYQESLERLSKLESEVSRAHEDFEGLNERANKADDEVRTLKEDLARLEAEKETSLLHCQQSMEKIADLEKAFSHAKEDIGESNEQVRQAKTEAEALKQELIRLESEKDAALFEHRQSLEMIATLEKKLVFAEENARKLGETAEKAETEVETLKKALAKLAEEKEAACLQYEQCLATISSLEEKLFSTQEEAQRLRDEIESGAAKLKVAEEQCSVLERSNQSLHSELESLVMKSGAQSEEITEKQQELGRLWACIQEERLRFIEAETAFQTLQHLHNQTQEELRSMASELQNRTQLLRDFESHNQSLQDEVEKIKEANKGLTEVNMSSSISIKDMQSEIFSLRETKGKLEEEVDLRVDQRNALQQEIYCLKEELNELNKKHAAILDQIEGVGLNPDSFGSSVKELQEENLKTKEAYEKERCEKVALLEKLEIMEQLLEKNALLEISLADLSAELEGAREKIHALEDSFEALLEEKSTLVNEKATLITQLQETTEKLEKLSEKNTFLENSLLDAHDELEGLKRRSKTLEDSCQLLENEKSNLINEKDTLDSQVVITQQSLNELEMRYRDLEEKYSCLEKEKDAALYEVEGLCASLVAKEEELERITQMNEKQLATIESEMHLLRDEGCRRRRDLEQELDKSVDYQVEIFILQRYIQDLKEKDTSLSVEFQKLLEASIVSEQLISELRNENVNQKGEVKSLSEEAGKLRMGMHELLIAFGIDADRGCDDGKIGIDHSYVKHMLTKLDDTKSFLSENVDKSQQLEVETSVLVTLLGQLRKEAATIVMDKDVLDQELRRKNEELSMVKIKANKLQETTEELNLKVKEKDQKEASQQNEIENLGEVLLEMQGVIQKLQKEKSMLFEKKGTLTKEFLVLEGHTWNLEEENLSLEVETSVLVTLFGQLRKEAATIAMDKAVLDQELRMKNEELSMVQIKANKLQETTADLNLQVKEKDQKEASQRNEIENLGKVLLEMQGAVQKLKKEKSILFEEKGTLTKEFLALEGHARNLEEENLSLEVETSVLVTLLGQLRKEAATIAMDKAVLDQELRRKNEELFMLQIEANKLQEMIENLKLLVKEKDQKETSQQNAIENLGEVLLEMQGAIQKLQKEKSMLLEEKGTLKKELLDLEGRTRNLEEENLSLIGETLSLSHLSLIFENIVIEKSVKLKEHSEDIENLRSVNGLLEEKLRLLLGKMEEAQNENMQLKELLSNSRDEIASIKDLLEQKEFALSESQLKVATLENMQKDLQNIMEDLKREHDEVKIIKDVQERKILKLSDDSNLISKEKDCLREANRELSSELQELREEHEKAKNREKSLFAELQKGNSEMGLLESEAASLFGQLQMSLILQVLLEEKVGELAEACKSLGDEVEFKDVNIKLLKDANIALDGEAASLFGQLQTSLILQALLEEKVRELAEACKSLGDEAESKAVNIILLKDANVVLDSEAASLFGQLQTSLILQVLLEEKVRELAEACKSLGDEAEIKGVNIKLLKDTNVTLEGENGGLKAKLGAYALAMKSLNDCVASLEDHLGLHKDHQKSNQEGKDGEVANHDPAEQSSTVQNGSGDLPELQDLETRLKAIEKALIETEHAGKEESANVKAKLEAATMEIEELKLKASMNQANVKRGSEISEPEEGLLTKDIMLDQVSECSSYGINRRENFGSWDVADLGGSFGHVDVEGKKPENNKNGVSEIHSEKEKELAVGKLEISKTFSGPRREVDRTKILQRLNSDVQKLTNLQITVQDLKKKVSTTTTQKSKTPKAIAEREDMKLQLDEAEEAILKLFEVNSKLSKGVDETPFSGDAKTAMGVEERENLRRRRLSEQARRVSEKIGRLQLEIQKLQFILLKIDSENDKESRERRRVDETSRRVLLRDYLYGAVRSGNKKKRAAFCACVRPPTRGD